MLWIIGALIVVAFNGMTFLSAYSSAKGNSTFAGLNQLIRIVVLGGLWFYVLQENDPLLRIQAISLATTLSIFQGIAR